MDIVVVGSINMDLVVNVDRIPQVGETILATDYKTYGGGKGANQALAAAKLGSRVAMIGKVGRDDYGRSLLNKMQEEGLDTSGVEFSSQPTGQAFIQVDSQGRNNIVVYPGANYRVDIDQVKRHRDLIINSKYCIVQLEIAMETVEYVIDLCHEHGVKLILNPAPAVENLRRASLEKVDLLIPNETELEIITGLDYSQENLGSMVDRVLDLGVKDLVVTLGSQGGIYLEEGQIRSYEPVLVEAVDTTGAGDSFVGGLTTGLVEGKVLKDAIYFASHVAALAVTRKGAQSSLASREELESFMGR